MRLASLYTRIPCYIAHVPGGCQTLASSSCSGCGREEYCGSICQKADWKVHKPMCPVLKTLSKELLPYRKLDKMVEDIGESKFGSTCRVLEHVLAWSYYQSGQERIIVKGQMATVSIIGMLRLIPYFL